MKLCSHCGATYDDRVEFCFADGTPLRAATAAERAAQAAPPPVMSSSSAIDVPEPRNMRFDDVPEPQFLRALPPTNDRPGHRPLGDAPTVPIPLVQAAPILEEALPPIRDDGPLPSSQDTLPLPTPPLKRGEDWDEPEEAAAAAPPEGPSLGEPASPGFGSFNPAETAPFRPSVGQEPFGGAPTMVPDSESEPEAEAEDPDSVDLARETFAPEWGGAAEETERPPSSSSGLMGGLLAIGALILVGGGGYLLWKNSQPPAKPVAALQTPAPEVVVPVPTEPAKAKAKVKATPPKRPEEAAPAVVEPVEAEPVVADVEPDRTQRVVPVEPPRETTPAPTATTALLSVSTDPPGAVVWIDNVRAGQAPVARQVDIGLHSVRAELDGYVSQTVKVSADEGGSSARIPLKPEPKSEVVVRLFGPPDAQVFVDGNNVGRLPVSVPLSPGGHDFKVVTTSGVTYDVRRDISTSTPSVSLLAD